VRVLRVLAIAAALLAVLGGLVWAFRIPLLLRLPGLVRDVTHPIGPNRPVVWQAGPERAAAPPSERPPNVVLILADDLGWNDVSLHGGGLAGGTVPTPHIDSIAREGVDFLNGYAGNAVCAPSRAMLLTGRYSTRFGFEFTPTPPGMPILASLIAGRQDRLHPMRVDRDAARSAPSFAEMGMPPSEVTLAELLRERGYRTLHVGKWHLGRAPGFRPRDQGFDESLLMESGLYLPQDHPDAVNSKQDFDPIDRFLWPNMRWAVRFEDDADAFEPSGYLTDAFTDAALDAIEANRNRPFFLYLAHWAPHTPLQALRSDYDALGHIEDHRLRVYAAMVRALDRSVGRVLGALAEHGLAENTLVLFTSDNGGAHYIGLPEVNQPYRGWKLTLFEGGTHVPFAARWPRRIEPGLRYAAPVSHLDVFATAAAAGGAPLPADRRIDGVDLLPFVRRERTGRPHETLVWRSGHYQALRHGDWKLQVSRRPDAVRLFDLATDPLEQHDLAPQRPDRVRALQERLDAHNRAQAEPLWPSVLEAPVPVDKTLAEPEAADDVYVYWPN
jgi:uncharacterized sulfatase